MLHGSNPLTDSKYIKNINGGKMSFPGPGYNSTRCKAMVLAEHTARVLLVISKLAAHLCLGVAQVSVLLLELAFGGVQLGAQLRHLRGVVLLREMQPPFLVGEDLPGGRQPLLTLGCCCARSHQRGVALCHCGGLHARQGAFRMQDASDKDRESYGSLNGPRFARSVMTNPLSSASPVLWPGMASPCREGLVIL